MKPDERRLLEELRRRDGERPPATPQAVAAEQGMSTRRLLLLCQGWWAKRWLERSPDSGRGADFMTGRLTPAGMAAELGG